MNPIPERQNAEPQLVLMRARSRIYQEATAMLVAQFAFTVLLPVAATLLTLVVPDAKPYTVALSLVVTVVDVTLLDRLQRAKLKLAAKIAETFDCAVLALDWNAFVAQKRVDPETVAAAATAWRGGDAKLRDWYPTAVGKAPLHLARIICQRTNLWYDATLRRHYGTRLLGFAGVLLAALFVGAYVEGLTLEVFVASVMAPAAPVLIWTLREWLRQRDTADAQDVLKGEAEALWSRAKTGGCDDAECSRLSRDFQNAIYARRVSSPLMMPGFYSRKRPAMEDQMNRGAEFFLAELGL